jgi:hypothetical protein
MNWDQFLTKYSGGIPGLFSPAFLDRWGKERWNPSSDDRTAALMLHTQIHSRITTQRLDYLNGVEKTALESVYVLFNATRSINNRFPAARHFDVVAWEVLNTKVRPFTAKWHGETERGTLAALDATDEFRAELTELQKVLRTFDNLLLKLHNENAPAVIDDAPDDREVQVADEMKAPIAFGIHHKYGGIAPKQAAAINESEKNSIKNRRDYYKVRQNAPDAIGLALSGGGIRSATFSLGVLVALARRGLLPQIDYLSTVSGGGYVGSFLSAFLNSAGNGEIGLGSTQLPFLRESGEAQALRHIRHRCKYLSAGSIWQQAAMVFAQLYGMALNGLAVGIILALVVVVEHLLRTMLFVGTLGWLTTAAICFLVFCVLFSFLTLRMWRRAQKYSDCAMVTSVTFLLLVLCIRGLAPAHIWYSKLSIPSLSGWSNASWLAMAGAVPVLASALATLLARFRKHLITVLLILTGIAAPIFIFGLYLALYELFSRLSLTLPHQSNSSTDWILTATVILGLPVYFFLFDINSTSPHRHYRDRLAGAFLIQPRGSQNAKQHETTKETTAETKQDTRFDAGVSIKLSQLTQKGRSPYHLINCALNVPSSKNIALQGRLTDFFLFTPSFSGSPLTGYQDTREWEAADPQLNLATAMAISAAAAAPQMGLGTMKTLSFWLALLNIRLGYWARKPHSKVAKLIGGPGLFCLMREMLGTMNEKSSWLNLTDGGHIENLGVYELLRRRCKYIIAIDGEQDTSMTFHALTTLQRLAAIDFGVRIDVNLDDLRLNDQRLSRSHFRFCRIRYPKAGRGSQDEFGYLLYVKLSLTGNEGEFIRRYRLDNPAFPHDSTADQFFTEAQFEAYRSLGEHVGNKLFLRAIVGELADEQVEQVKLEEWFLRLGQSLLDPLPKTY